MIEKIKNFLNYHVKLNIFTFIFSIYSFILLLSFILSNTTGAFTVNVSAMITMLLLAVSNYYVLGKMNTKYKIFNLIFPHVLFCSLICFYFLITFTHFCDSHSNGYKTLFDGFMDSLLFVIIVLTNNDQNKL